MEDADRTGTGRLVLVVAILASFVAFLDGTVTNVALPAIARELGGGLTTQQWVVDAYLVTLGALILLAGSLSDTWGRVRMLRIGLVLFAAASLAIAAAPSVPWLVAWRAVQGAGGALLVPSSLALITAHFDGERRSRAIGIWTGATTAAMLIGPVLGGVFVDLASWRWAFLINVVPIAATLVLLARPGMPRDTRTGGRVDLFGGALSTAGLGGMVFAMISEPALGWGSAAVWAPLAAGAGFLTLFIARQRRVPNPVLPLGLFRHRNFWAGNLATLFVYAALGLNGLVLAVYLQQEAGLSATAAGLALLPSTILMILFSARTGQWAGQRGPRVFMTVGPAVMAAGALLLLGVREDFDYATQVLPSVIVFGAGLTLTVAPLTSAVLGAVSAERSGVASAVNNAVARVAGLIAVAVVGSLVSGMLDLDGFRRAAVVCAILLALGAIASWVGIRNPPPSPDGTPGAGA